MLVILIDFGVPKYVGYGMEWILVLILGAGDGRRGQAQNYFAVYLTSILKLAAGTRPSLSRAGPSRPNFQTVARVAPNVASTAGVLREADVHLRTYVLEGLVTYVLGRCLGVGVPIHLGWQTKAMDERLQELLPAVETYFWRKWVEKHAEHCSKTCASIVILDGNLKCFSRQCCAETGSDMVPGTNLQVKRFCSGFTRGTRDRLCANAACQSAAPQLRKLVEGAKSDLQERYNAARRRNAAVGRSCAARDTSGADDVDEEGLPFWSGVRRLLRILLV